MDLPAPLAWLVDGAGASPGPDRSPNEELEAILPLLFEEDACGDLMASS